MGSARIVADISSVALCHRREGLIAVFEIAMDESGIHGEASPIIAAGACLATRRTWIEFTKDWNRAKKGIDVYHAVDAANLKGEFKGWSELKRDKLFISLCEVINRHRPLTFSLAVRMNDFREVCAEYPEMAMTEAEVYDFCFHGVVRMVMEFLERNGDATNLAFIHEETDHIGIISETFNYLQRDLKGPKRNFMTLTFAGKKEFTPLQAADILAYETNKRTRNPKGQPRRSWTALNPDGDRRHYSLFNKQALTKWAEWRRSKGYY